MQKCNWWLIKCKEVNDCVEMHNVTPEIIYSKEYKRLDWNTLKYNKS